MRACVQRVSRALVTVEGAVVGKIQAGLLVMLGVATGDSQATVEYLSDKIVSLRVFPDVDGKMNRSLLDTGGQMLVVSQFTLLGDCRRGRRPSYTDAALPDLANSLYEAFVAAVRASGVHVECGRFRAQMNVELVNDGPVTLLLDSSKLF